jgi:hypothetical protein
MMDMWKRHNEYFANLEKEYYMVYHGEPLNLCGYVENLCEGGIGVSSLGTLAPGSKVIADIGPIYTQTISPSATLVFSRVDGHLYYYGFKFTSLSERDRTILKKIIQTLTSEQCTSV